MVMRSPRLDPGLAIGAAQATGGTPPGMPPPNAFDMDPAELEAMVSQGWQVGNDGTLSPPAGPSGVGSPQGYDLGGGGYDQALGGAPALGGGGGPPLPAGGAVPPPVGGAGALGGAPPLGAAGAMGGGLGNPASVAPLAGGGSTGPPTGGLGGLAGLGDQLSAGISAAAAPGDYFGGGGPPPTGGPGGGASPPGGPALPPLSGETPPPARNGLDPFAYTKSQNAASLAPAAVGAGAGDPGGYAGADVGGSDPRNLIPSRRRRGSPNGVMPRPQPRVGLTRTPTPQQRP